MTASERKISNRIEHGGGKMKPVYGMRRRLSAVAVIVLLALAVKCAKSPKVEPRGPENATAEEIVKAVEDELVVNQGVSAHLVDVSAEDGIVTLSGTVENLLEEDMAIRIARSVWGVRAVIDRIEVRTPPVPDGELTARITAALAADPAADAYEVTARATDGIATLKGRVDSWSERLLCGEVTRGVKGVRKVENRIMVDQDRARPDAEIKADIERRFALDPRIPQWLIEVNVEKGIARLAGAVGNAVEKERAANAAYVLGVKRVDTSKLETEVWARDEM
ncbi:MAG: BON domain-containing protein, partial [Chitinivibrionales bacterium]|nr:BON domain-containing protein [Chitinivibrionales bacterium]